MACFINVDGNVMYEFEESKNNSSVPPTGRAEASIHLTFCFFFSFLSCQIRQPVQGRGGWGWVRTKGPDGF